jgi:hypothetical protein
MIHHTWLVKVLKKHFKWLPHSLGKMVEWQRVRVGHRDIPVKLSSWALPGIMKYAHWDNDRRWDQVSV